MAGHSKWANIQHRKRGQDIKRGKVFTKLIREISVAARMGGSDASSNPRLRLAVDKALQANMPKDTLERAVKRGAGELEGMEYVEVRYEGYGPTGTAVMVDCLTDNHRRTVADVRHVFTKYGGSLGTDGSVSYLFSRLGLIILPEGSDEEQVFELVLEAGADDVVANDDGTLEITTDPASFDAVTASLREAEFEPVLAEVTMQASTTAVLDEEGAVKFLKMQDALDELDDVQEVYTNAEIPDEVMASVE
ncbi:MAG: YebC/PmpR family DNA-binding transcriptional regulator [Gammaproteobacteria bacterium]|nr:YebC/PmpR family DNA-binding transcriptional regulator [Gammaproteobacteria bacterium]